jgi:hypothetical protein
MHDPRTDDDANRGGQPGAEDVLVAEVVASRTGSAECTIYPRELPEAARLTTWITAEDGSFVPLDEMR